MHGICIGSHELFFAIAFTLLYHALFKVVQFLLFKASFPNKFNIQSSILFHLRFIHGLVHHIFQTDNIRNEPLCPIMILRNSHAIFLQSQTFNSHKFPHLFYTIFDSNGVHLIATQAIGEGGNVQRAVKLLILINKYFSWQHTCLKEL